MGDTPNQSKERTGLELEIPDTWPGPGPTSKGPFAGFTNHALDDPTRLAEQVDEQQEAPEREP